MTLWQSFVRILMTSLFAAFLVFILVFTLKRLTTGRDLEGLLIKHKRAIYITLLVLIITLPIAFSLPEGIVLSPMVLVAWIRELIISISLVVVFFAIWITFNDPTAVNRVVLMGLLRQIISIQNQTPQSGLPPYEDVKTATQSFFSEEYVLLRKLIGEPLLEMCLKICHLRSVWIMEDYGLCGMICDADNLFESNSVYISLEGAGQLEMLQNRLNNYELDEKFTQSWFENLTNPQLKKQKPDA